MALVRSGRLLAALLVAVLDASPAIAGDVERWRASIEEASRRFGVPVPWIERVMRAESAGKTMMAGRPIVSSAGAMGLMQLMPATWRDVRAKLGLGHDPHEPRDNILAGTYYLRLMHSKFGYPGLFAAYNAGPGRYEQYLYQGRALPRETRVYVADITGRSVSPLRRWSNARTDRVFTPVTRGAGIFFVLSAQETAWPAGQPHAAPPDHLITVRQGASNGMAVPLGR